MLDNYDWTLSNDANFMNINYNMNNIHTTNMTITSNGIQSAFNKYGDLIFEFKNNK